MKVQKINSANNIFFQRKLREDEKADYKQTMNQAFDYLGIKNRALIIHGSSFPAQKPTKLDIVDSDYFVSKPSEANNYIGSPYFSEDFVDFVQMNGFNSIQLGPNGKLNKNDNSPYHSSVNAKNELFLNYGKLKTPEYASILSDDDFNSIKLLQRDYNSNYDMSNFEYAKDLSKVLLHKAYKNFVKKLKSGDEDALSLNNQFLEFKHENKDWLEKDSIFRVLSDIYGTDKFSKWDNELDKNLIKRLNENDSVAIERYKLLKSLPENKFKLDEYKFEQFLVDKQEKEDKAVRNSKNFKYIGDLLVGFSYSDEWSNPEAFLSDWRLGAPYGGENNGPQLWNIPMPAPDKLFNEDGSLGVSGKLLKDKFSHALRGVENIRIDNVMGLVDPYIYKSSKVKPDNTIDREHGGLLSELAYLDKNNNYRQILHRILIPALKENGIDSKDVVWEDLGEQSSVFRDTFYGGVCNGRVYEDEKQKGVAYTIGMQMEKNPNYSYSFLATHDNEPSVNLLKQNWIYENDAWNPLYLAGYLIPPYNDTQARKSEEFCKKIAKVPQERLKAKFAELLRGTKNIQISFVDLYGINQVYNRAGLETLENWKLRLNSDYEDTYYKSLEEDNSTSLNMPEILELAVNSKAGLSIIRKEQTEAEVEAQIGSLKERLAHWKDVLKEKSN